MNDALARSAFPKRNADANKGDFGYVALVGGSLPYSGAIRLADRACEHALAACSQAAMRAGAGVCAIAAPRSICSAIVPQILEATLYPLSERGDHFLFDRAEFLALARRYDVIAFGMGAGNTPETTRAVRWLLTNYTGTLILDADGLNAFARLRSDRLEAEIKPVCRLILTPHVKEFSRLSGLSVSDIQSDPVGAAVSLAEQLKAIVLLKGQPTVIADGRPSDDGSAGTPVLLSATGTPGMATAGSGDVLSGLLAALAAQNPGDLFLATAAAAYINGLAGELAAAEHGEVSMLASDTAANVERVIRYLTDERDPE